MILSPRALFVSQFKTEEENKAYKKYGGVGEEVKERFLDSIDHLRARPLIQSRPGESFYIKMELQFLSTLWAS